MHPTLHLIIDSAELELPLEVGEQPSLRLTAHIAGSFDLLNDAHEEIGEFQWNFTISRAATASQPPFGRAVAVHAEDSTGTIEANYRVGPEAFDRLERQLSRGKSLVSLSLVVAGIKQRPNDGRWQWSKAREGSNILAMTGHAEF